MTNIRVDVVSEINRCGARGQIDDVASRCKHVDAFFENIGLHAVDELARIIDVLPPFHQGTQPDNATFIVVIFAGAFLVTPMRCDTVFSILVHFWRADLDLQCLAIIMDDRSVQRLIKIVFWCGDIVVKFMRNWSPVGVDDAQRRIAISYRRHQNTHPAHIEDHIERDALTVHFSIDRINVFWPAGDVRFYAGLFQ